MFDPASFVFGIAAGCALIFLVEWLKMARTLRARHLAQTKKPAPVNKDDLQQALDTLMEDIKKRQFECLAESNWCARRFNTRAEMIQHVAEDHPDTDFARHEAARMEYQFFRSMAPGEPKHCHTVSLTPDSTIFVWCAGEHCHDYMDVAWKMYADAEQEGFLSTRVDFLTRNGRVASKFRHCRRNSLS
jgi:hypothetical protein